MKQSTAFIHLDSMTENTGAHLVFHKFKVAVIPQIPHVVHTSCLSPD